MRHILEYWDQAIDFDTCDANVQNVLFENTFGRVQDKFYCGVYRCSMIDIKTPD